VIVGLVLSLIIIFKQIANPALVLPTRQLRASRSAHHGLFDDSSRHRVQAILGTFSVFAGISWFLPDRRGQGHAPVTKWINRRHCGRGAADAAQPRAVAVFTSNIGVP